VPITARNHLRAASAFGQGKARKPYIVATRGKWHCIMRSPMEGEVYIASREIVILALRRRTVEKIVCTNRRYFCQAEPPLFLTTISRK